MQRHGAVAIVVAALALGASLGCTSRSGPDEATLKMIKRLKDSDRDQREMAARILSQKRGQEIHVAPALIEALGDRDPIVAGSAAEALRMLLGRPDMSDQRSAWEEYWNRAKKKFEEHAKRSPDERMKAEKAGLENDRGYLYLMQGKLALAEGHFLEAAALDPDDPKYWNNLGKCRMQMGKLPDAVDALRTGLEKDPTYGMAHYNLGEAHLEMTRLTGADQTYEALGHAEAAIKVDPKLTDWGSRWLKARILFHKAMAEPAADQRAQVYEHAWNAISEAIGIVELTRGETQIAQVRKTAALIAYGRETYYRAYKEVARVYELGFEMDPDFVSRLDEALKREAYKSGAEAPQMPKGQGPAKDSEPPPALRTPYGDGE
jgi:tetratricopeptide (TPR) repeat protein